MSERYQLNNGRIIDNESSNTWNLNNEDDKVRICKYLNTLQLEVIDVNKNREQLNEEIESAYDRIREKGIEMINIKQKLNKEMMIRIEYEHIIESYQNIIKEMKR